MSMAVIKHIPGYWREREKMQVDSKSSVSNIAAEKEYNFNELIDDSRKNKQILQELDFGVFLLDEKINIQDN